MEGTEEAMWLKRMLEDLHIGDKRPVAIYCDNQGGISLTKSPVFHNRTKHFQVHYHFSRE